MMDDRNWLPLEKIRLLKEDEGRDRFLREIGEKSDPLDVSSFRMGSNDAERCVEAAKIQEYQNTAGVSVRIRVSVLASK
jgi:hypothetical protein